jgi:hypothetical protein
MQPHHRQQSSMIESYNIIIPNEKAATYKVVTFIISLINLVAFIYVAIRSGWDIGMILTIGLLSGLSGVMLFVIQHYWGMAKKIQPAIFLLLSSVCWLIAGMYFIGIMLFIFSLLSLLTIKPLVISFTGDGILYPSFPAKLIGWNEVDFVILKDDVLSIELKNNKLMQFTLEKSVANGIDAGEFNSFCARRKLQ